MKIGIFAGDSHEAFSPPSVNTGVGGSEEAVIHISKQLKLRGHDVSVWNNCDKPGDYDGVSWADFMDYNEDEVDIMVGWRTEQPWKYVKNYKVGYLWLHDTLEPKRVALAQNFGADKVMVLSRYHRQLYPGLRNEEIFRTTNGIDPTHFDQKVKRVPYRMFWGSSYDRSLKDVLEHWPKIKLAYPEATLHIAYGWNTWKSIARATGGEGYKAFKRIRIEMERMMNQEGITHLGRISHQEVAKEFLAADVWGYPTFWPEISCITAMKAQAAGAIPVVAPTAALSETVRFGVKTDRGFYHDLKGNIIMPDELMNQWVEGVKSIFGNKDREEYREKMMTRARIHFDWATVAEKWEEEFKNALQHRDKTKKS